MTVIALPAKPKIFKKKLHMKMDYVIFAIRQI